MSVAPTSRATVAMVAAGSPVATSSGQRSSMPTRSSCSFTLCRSDSRLSASVSGVAATCTSAAMTGIGSCTASTRARWPVRRAISFATRTAASDGAEASVATSSGALIAGLSSKRRLFDESGRTLIVAVAIDPPTNLDCSARAKVLLARALTVLRTGANWPSTSTSGVGFSLRTRRRFTIKKSGNVRRDRSSPPDSPERRAAVTSCHD